MTIQQIKLRLIQHIQFLKELLHREQNLAQIFIIKDNINFYEKTLKKLKEN